MDIAQLGVYACLFLALYFEVFLLISFLEKRPAQKSNTLPTRYPHVSIIVPCYNEEKTVASTLGSLLALQYPKEKLDIVVVDDGSRDQTRAIVERDFLAHPQVTFFHKENGGKYTAVNWGIANSTGELVGCLDADSFVAPDALLEVIKKFEEDPAIMAITPAMKVYRPRTMLELMQSVEYTFGIFYKKMFDNLAALSVLPGPFSVYRREVFLRIGNFRHAHNTEDMEIAFRMQANHLKIVNAHTAFVYTTVPKTARALLRQRTRWSQGFLQNSLDYAHLYLNPRYGNFGMMTLPFGLLGFMAGLYVALYELYQLLNFSLTHLLDAWTTHVPLTLPAHVDWLYLNTGSMTFVVIAVLGFTGVAIFLGKTISKTDITLKSLFSYFALFGFLAPLWLARALWGTVFARESVWR